MAMTLRLDDATAEALKAQAAQDGRSVHQTVLLAVNEFLVRHRRADHVSTLAHQAAADFPEVLRRLGE